jgi:hypothetical protein
LKIERIYHVKLNYTPGVSDPSKIFIAYSNSINSFRKIDLILGKTLSYSTKCKQTLEDIQLGSITSKIKELFEYSDDELPDQKKAAIAKDIEEYVSYGTTVILDTINNGEKINSPKQIEKISEKINTKARNSSVGHLISYAPPANTEIIDAIKNLSESVQSLTENEILEYQEDNVIIQVPKKIEVDVQKIETEMNKQYITSERELILKIKDPHFLGNAKWGFKHGNKNIEAKMEDPKWNDDFYNKKSIILHPGDSLQVVIELYEEYDKYGQLIKEEYTIVKVKDVIPGVLDDE